MLRYAQMEYGHESFDLRLGRRRGWS